MTRRLFNIAAILLPWLRPRDEGTVTGQLDYRGYPDNEWHTLATVQHADGTKKIYHDGKLIRTLKGNGIRVVHRCIDE